MPHIFYKGYVFSVMFFLQQYIVAMELVNVSHDIIANIALQLVDNNPVPFAFNHKNTLEHTNNTLNFLLWHARYATFSYLSLTLTCKKIYEVLNIKSFMPKRVYVCTLVQWLDNFRNTISEQMEYDLIHYYDDKEIKERFVVDITCWAQRANVQWAIKCIQTNQVRNKDGILSALKGNRPLLKNTPFWVLLNRFMQYTKKEDLRLTHVKKINFDECSFIIAGVFHNMPGNAQFEAFVIYSLLQKIARLGYFNWIDDTDKELVTSYFDKHCIMPDSGKT